MQREKNSFLLSFDYLQNLISKDYFNDILSRVDAKETANLVLDLVQKRKKKELLGCLEKKNRLWNEFAFLACCLINDKEIMNEIKLTLWRKIYVSFQLKDLEIIKYLGENYDDWDQFINEAVLTKKIEIVKYVLSKGITNYNDGFYEACRTGNLEIYNLFCDKKGDFDWEDALNSSLESGNLELIEKVFEKSTFDREILDQSLNRACRLGDIEAAKFFISKGAGHFKRALDMSCKSGFLLSLYDILIYFQKKKKQAIWNWLNI